MSKETQVRSNQEGEVDASLQRLRAMLAADPNNESLRRHVVDKALAAGNFHLVESLSKQVLTKDPDNATALFDQATALIGLKEYGRALRLLGPLHSRMPNESAISVNAGLCHYCLGQFDEAQEYLERCYSLNVRSVDIVRLLVSTYHHLGHIDKAIAVANENSQVASDNAALAGIYSLLFLDGDDIAGAAKWTKVALDLDAKSIEGRLTQSTLLTARMETDRAREILDSLLQDAPNLGRAWVGLGTLDLLSQNLADAKKRLSRGVELMPSHVGSWHVLAWTQLISGELAEAESSFAQALELDRNFAETHGGIAAVAAIRGERVKAERAIEVALRLDKACLSAKFAQSVLVGATDQKQARQQILDAANVLSTRDGSALSRLLAKVAKAR